MKAFKFTCGFLLLALTGCIATKEVDNSVYVRAPDEIKGEMQGSQFFKSCRVLPLETNEKSIFRRLSKICCDDGKLFVFDRSLNKIIIFDMNGKYLTNILHIGGGPKEYQGACDFCLDTLKKQILLLCDRPQKVICYDYSGQFVKEHKLDGSYMNIATNTKSIFMSKPETISGKKSKYELYRFSTDFKLEDSYFPARDNITSIIYESAFQLSSTKNVHFTRRFDNSIYLLGENGVEKKYNIDFNMNSFSESLLNNEITTEIALNVKKKKLVYSIHNVIENKNYIMFTTNLSVYLYDKLGNELSAYKSIEVPDFGMGIGEYISIGNRGDMIATTLSASFLDLIRKSIGNIKNLNLLDLLKQVDIEDNPVLFLYEFKD